MNFIQILSDLQKYAGAISGVLVAIIGLCLLIPGEQPEKTLQKIVDFISKFSKK